MTVELKDQSLFQTQAYINGQWVDADSGEQFEVLNPANGELVARCANAGAAETHRAIAAAEQAMQDWKQRTAKQRAVILRKWFELVVENQQDLAKLMTVEQGKPLAEALNEVNFGASFIEWFAEEAPRNYGDTLPTLANDRRFVTIKQPVGVVAAITPWNFPAAMICRKAGPALAAGCSIVIKPAEATPLSALALAVLAERAGLPAGVLNIVVGDRSQEIGAALLESKTVRKLTFTGSTRVGKYLLANSAETVKKVSMELGGDAPVLVFDDADLDAAVDGAIASKYRNAGQTCVCANRIYVQDSVYDAFVSKFVAKAREFELGNGLDAAVTMGPLINQQAVANMKGLVADAIDKGAELLTGGNTCGDGERFFEPTVLANVTKEMRVANEELFGPIAPIFKFSTEDEAIAMANDSDLGLASYLYSRDIGRCWRVGEALEYGMVGINETGLSNCVIPFGGVKESGMGREGSKYGMDDYTEIKYLCMGGI